MISPAGPLSEAIDGLRTLVAAVPFFVTWVSPAGPLSRVFTGEVGSAIASVSIVTHVLTVKTREPHTFSVNDVVTIDGAAVGEQSIDIDGPVTVTAVTSTSFTAALSLPNLAETPVDHAFVLPCGRPLAVVCKAGDGVRSTSIGTDGASVYRGELEILLEADVSPSYVNDPLNAQYEADNAFGQFVQGLTETAGTGDYMVLNTIDPTSGPEFTSKPEQDDNTVRFERWRALVKVGWGLDG